MKKQTFQPELSWFQSIWRVDCEAEITIGFLYSLLCQYRWI